MPRGGYQKPTNGAVVSPPGALSKRKAVENNAKENIPSGGGYGERKAMQQQLQGAPLAKSQQVVNKLNLNISPELARKEQMVPLTAETQRPEEQFSMGFSFGGGLKPTDIGLPMGTSLPENDERKQDLQKLSTLLPIIRNVCNTEGAPQTLRTFCKFLESQ